MGRAKGRVSSLQGKILQPVGSTIRNRGPRRLTGAAHTQLICARLYTFT